MSLRQELEQWNSASQAFEAGDFGVAIDIFDSLADSSKIHFNIGMIFLNMRQYEDAVSV
jgi:hypothetical protein